MPDGSMDVSQFVRACNFVLDTTKKKAPEYLNRKTREVIIGSNNAQGKVRGAIQRTRRATKEDIKNVSVEKIAAAVVKKAKQKGQWPLTRLEINRRIKKEYSRRVSSIAYTGGAGWLKAAIAFGGTGGKTRKPQAGFNKSKASKGSGKKAAVGRLTSELTNTAPAAALIGTQALQDALDDCARDMTEYGAKQLLKKTFEQVSAH